MALFIFSLSASISFSDSSILALLSISSLCLETEGAKKADKCDKKADQKLIHFALNGISVTVSEQTQAI